MIFKDKIIIYIYIYYMTNILSIINAFCDFNIKNSNITKRFQNLKFNKYDTLTQILFNQKSVNEFDPTLYTL